MDNTFTLKGERVLVTGGGKGLGRHFALVAARAGADVAITGRNVASLNEVEVEIRKLGVKAYSVAMDVTDPASVDAAIAKVEQEFGALTVVVNNAGVAISKPAFDQSVDDFNMVIDTDLKGVFWVASAAAKHMSKRKAGAIVNIASILGEVPVAALAPYAASKAGVIQMTKALALEWARYGLRVNALAPGYFETDMNREFFSTERGQVFLKRVAQRRLGALDELTGPFLLLASKASSFMNGSTLRVDGGFGLV